jgi:hypothetical protein
MGNEKAGAPAFFVFYQHNYLAMKKYMLKYIGGSAIYDSN